MKKLKEFVEQFDFNKPNWSQLPEGFPECELSGLSSEELLFFKLFDKVGG